MFMMASTVFFLLVFTQKEMVAFEKYLPKNVMKMIKVFQEEIPSIKFRPEWQKPEIIRKCSVRRKKSLTCQKLFETPIVKRLEGQSEEANDTEATECSLEELVKDCPKLRFEHGYEDKPVSQSELEFPLAFAIKMHTNSHQVERLLRTIYRPHNFYCIHVDSKTSDETYKLIKNVADCLKNVVVLSKRMNVAYASFRLVLVEFACMKCSMESGVKWKYYINLTGQEFMLKTNLEIVEILKMFNGVNDIESDTFWIRWRHRYIYKIVGNNLINTKIPYSRFKSNITIYKGSAYGMFSREFVDFVLNDDVVKPVFNWLKKRSHPKNVSGPPSICYHSHRVVTKVSIRIIIQILTLPKQ